MKEHISEIHEEGKNPSNLTFVITALLTRAVQLNTLLQFTMLKNHSNVTFVTPVFTKRNTLLRFMKARNLSHVIYLCNQSYLIKGKLEKTFFCSSLKSYLIKKTYSLSSWWKNQIVQMKYLWSIGFKKSMNNKSNRNKYLKNQYGGIQCENFNSRPMGYKLSCCGSLLF